MRRRDKRGLRCAGCAAAVVVACLPLTSCDNRSAQADAVGYVAIFGSQVSAESVAERPVNTVSAPEAAVPTPVPPLGPVPPYAVIAERTNDRSDRATTYYVVLGPSDPAVVLGPSDPAAIGAAPATGDEPEPVQLLADGDAPAELVPDVVGSFDPTAAGFKPAVKQVLKSLALMNGGPDFSAHIWDEATAAQTEVSYKSAPEHFSDHQYAAKEAGNARHLVASYYGGTEPVGQPQAYVLSWFPDAEQSLPLVGPLMSSEVWTP